MADKEWPDIRSATRQRHGAVMGGIEDRTLRLTDYSAPLPAQP